MYYNKEEVLEKFTILTDTIKKVLKDKHYKESYEFLTKFNNFLTEWEEKFKKSNTLIDVSSDKLKYFQIELSEFFVTYEDYDLANNCYTEILSFHYTKLLKHWKTNYLK